MAYSAHPWCVFNVQDNIVPSTPGVLGGFSFVERVLDGSRKRFSLLPFVGQIWYHRVATELLLHHGQIDWSCITHSYSSSSHLPADVFREPLDRIEAAHVCDKLQKQGPNQMVGLWAVNGLDCLSVKSSSSIDDLTGTGSRRAFAWSGGVIHDLYVKSHRLDNTSYRPLRDQIMQTEQARVAQLRVLLEAHGVPRRFVTDIKTDSVVLHGHCRSLQHKVECIVVTTFRDLPGTRRGLKRKRLEDGQTLLDSYCELTGCDADVSVYRWGHKPTRLIGNHSEPYRNAEPAEPLGDWTDLSPDSARDHVMEGGSLLVTGSPGTGKTHWCRELVTDLRAKGLSVTIIAKTHLSVQNFGEGTVTADHWVRKQPRRGHCSCDVLVIEEISQISTYLWNDVGKCLHVGCRFVLLGDFKQLDAVCDTWAGVPVPQGALERSDLLYELCSGVRMELTENMRSDAILFDFYTGLWRDGVVFSEALLEARALFPLPARFSLTISNAARQAVNRACSVTQKRKHPEAVFVKGVEPFWTWPGAVLVGAGGPCRQGIFYTIASIDEHIVLESGERLTHEAAGRSLRLCHALVYASVQGLTLPDTVRLLETEHQHFTKKHLYRCVARNKSPVGNFMKIIATYIYIYIYSFDKGTW